VCLKTNGASLVTLQLCKRDCLLTMKPFAERHKGSMFEMRAENYRAKDASKCARRLLIPHHLSPISASTPIILRRWLVGFAHIFYRCVSPSTLAFSLRCAMARICPNFFAPNPYSSSMINGSLAGTLRVVGHRV